MTSTVGQVRIAWADVVQRAAEIGGSYSTPVTLRQLFYRLVSEQALPNRQTAYKTLSSETAKARRDGWFPRLLDQGRRIENIYAYDDPVDAIRRVMRNYRRDRTEGQDQVVWVVLEKATLVEQVVGWLDDFGTPVVALRGYGSQTIIDEIVESVEGDDRPAIAVYVGDLDPSGEDIERDLQDRTGYSFDEVRRIAVTFDQVAEYGLIAAPGKATDTRSAAFRATHGQLIQVEVEAIDPRTLQGLVLDAVTAEIDYERLDRVHAVERRERELLNDALGQLAIAQRAMEIAEDGDE